ncbi:hypothetical protein SpiGrapes_0996 [Sphaerochaeta pleomorpha str. Grapes]|uniref:Outer membrane protein beta-barrel domain-containing protein n=1 Tax=Sphaerochaeta pleomorpha (strain ATCC BAA-1885 / DSM 22778 / Grapes) TaxID=158190 RepID=G8QRN8_SPHPG|nr:hypothetical protein [Sphaerochaeta pleomorpha]AEV28821.1 hypothetical protein SpiGrapes_0996 [Sphaerochaeta pleomorpha str. Grapes]
MKTAQKSIVCLLLLVIALSSVNAAVTWEPYLGFSKGEAKIDGEKIPFFELSLGTPLGSRTTIETFLLAQPLSDFPHFSCTANITDTDNAFALMTGIKTSLTLFKDATFNPMVQASLGQMIIGNLEPTANYPELSYYFYSSIATGFALNFFESFKILILSGYRFAPHDQVIGLESNALSSKFCSISFRADLD